MPANFHAEPLAGCGARSGESTEYCSSRPPLQRLPHAPKQRLRSCIRQTRTVLSPREIPIELDKVTKEIREVNNQPRKVNLGLSKVTIEHLKVTTELFKLTIKLRKVTKKLLQVTKKLFCGDLEELPRASAPRSRAR